MLGVKRARDHRRVAALDQFARHRERHLVVLLDVTAIELDLEAALRFRDALFGELARAFARHVVDDAREFRPVERAQARDEGAHEIVLQVGQQHAHRAQRRGFARNDLQRDIQFGADEAGVDGSGAAGRDEGELARIESALDGDFAHALCHVIAGHAVHAGSRFLDRQAHRPGDVLFDGRARRGAVEFHFPAGEEIGVEVTQHHVGVGGGR